MLHFTASTTKPCNVTTPCSKFFLFSFTCTYHVETVPIACFLFLHSFLMTHNVFSTVVLDPSWFILWLLYWDTVPVSFNSRSHKVVIDSQWEQSYGWQLTNHTSRKWQHVHPYHYLGETMRNSPMCHSKNIKNIALTGFHITHIIQGENLFLAIDGCGFETEEGWIWF